MSEWFDVSLDHVKLSFVELVGRLLLSLIFGGIVAGIYLLTQRRQCSELLPMTTTLVLLSVLIAMVTLIIGSNLARAFSLAGALAIIRFRTIVEDSRDTAFVIFAVVVGMGVGADRSIIPLIGIPIVGAAAVLISFSGRPLTSIPVEYSLAIRVGLGRNPQALFGDLFSKYLTHVRLRATATARQGSALEMHYIVRLREEGEPTTFVSELNRIDGVQSVELRKL